ncbi:terminase gpP N-terminus-related DNA-binding protein [Chryseobacterium daeguense]|uniref:terminase gpP N-terminus-related DNA-binding protein n=1 Tax=Chryseobacterium daeguense TaxID=412438 RepID=UPI000420D52F|nr:hypothetical protein [Chryseobacterium daeguense]
MARLTASDSDYKKSQGKDLFIKGFTLTSISEIIGIGVKTLSNWREKFEWEKERELNNIRPSEIKKLILQYVQDIKDGRKPTHKADDLSKISAAFDRLNDSRKKAVYTMETLDGFCSFMLEKAGKSQGKKRDILLEKIKEVRIEFDEYVTELLQND